MDAWLISPCILEKFVYLTVNDPWVSKANGLKIAVVNLNYGLRHYAFCHLGVYHWITFPIFDNDLQGLYGDPHLA